MESPKACPVRCKVESSASKVLYINLYKGETQIAYLLYLKQWAKGYDKQRDSVQIYARVDASSVLPNFHGNILCALHNCMVALKPPCTLQSPFRQKKRCTEDKCQWIMDEGMNDDMEGCFHRLCWYWGRCI